MLISLREQTANVPSNVPSLLFYADTRFHVLGGRNNAPVLARAFRETRVLPSSVPSFGGALDLSLTQISPVSLAGPILFWLRSRPALPSHNITAASHLHA